jgi:hypothetical protein
MRSDRDLKNTVRSVPAAGVTGNLNHGIAARYRYGRLIAAGLAVLWQDVHDILVIERTGIRYLNCVQHLAGIDDYGWGLRLSLPGERAESISDKLRFEPRRKSRVKPTWF